jgi:ribosomal-protein-alanine N-acetyltransferase
VSSQNTVANEQREQRAGKNGAPDGRLAVVIRRMAAPDIDQVVTLDRLSFTNPWPPRTYHYEVRNNTRSNMYVLEPGDGTSRPGPASTQQGWLERLIKPDGNNNNNGQSSPPPLIGYCGFWQIADEAHISTIAVHPDWRGYKLGELQLWSMIRHALRRQANKVTLEVRVSNTLAQNLYVKYGFEVVGRRRAYYSDNKEDAYNMLVGPLDDAYHARMVEWGRALAQRLRVTDLTR